MIGTSELDLQLAIQLQEQFEEELKQQKENVASPRCKQISKNVLSKSEAPLTVSLVDPVWELVDPVPDVHALFCTYNDQFFWGKLLSVSVSWSPRMTLCAGVCSYERRGGLCSIRLSVPLLKLRPRSDLVETLLHEMIHAYLFVTANNKDRDGHGPEFLKHMHRINAKARTKISVYHSFHDEVAMYQQHVWQCSGPCRQRRPYYGLVKRSMNRAPGPNDRWWSEHKRTCGGTYAKIKEPEGYGTKGVKRKAALPVNGTEAKRKANTVLSQDIRSFFTGSGKSVSGTAGNLSKPPFGGGSSSNNSAGTNVARASVDQQSSVSRVSKSNIKGFDSTASGAVKSVEVGNASRSKIVGFNKGLNKSASNSVNKNEGRSNSSWRSGSGGGLALGSGGTLVLNPKTNSRTTTAETKNALPSSKDEEGHVLGGDAAGSRSRTAVRSSGESGGKPQRPVSRLLAEYDATMASRNTKKQQNTSSIIQRNVNRSSPPSTEASSSSQSTDVSTGAHQLKLTNPSASDSLLPKKASTLNSFIDSDESDEDDVGGVKICPLCERSIYVNEFLSHISVCMGNWGEDVGLEMEDLPLLSTLKDLDDSNNACVPVGSSNDSEDSRMTDEATPRDVAGGSFLSRGAQSDFLGAPKKIKRDSNGSSGVLLKNEHGDKVRMKKMENDEVLVSDSDEEFDEKYWKKPILSVVQLAQGINKLGVDEGRERGACSLPSRVASSGSREHFGRNDDSATAPPTFPCPVCGELYTEEYITSVHMNTHFD